MRIAVILSKDSLYADRCAGITTIGEIISNLFTELKKNTLDGMTLLFNKFKEEEDIV